MGVVGIPSKLLNEVFDKYKTEKKLTSDHLNR